MSGVLDRNPWVVEHVDRVLESIDRDGPAGTDELAARLGLSPGGVALVIAYALEEALVTYDADGFHRQDGSHHSVRPGLAGSDDDAPRKDWD